MYKNIFSLFISFAFIITTGCATTPYIPYNQKAMNLKMEMPKEDVLNLLGQPKQTSAKKIEDGIQERYSYWTPSKVGYLTMDNEMLATDRLYVTLLNGKVIEWGDKYDPSAMIDKTLEINNKLLSKPNEINLNIKSGTKE